MALACSNEVSTPSERAADLGTVSAELGSAESICGGELAAPPLALRWLGLPPDEPATVTSGLRLNLVATGAGPLTANVSYEIIAGGRYTRGALAPITGITTSTPRVATLDLARISGVELATIEVSAQLIVRAEVRDSAGRFLGDAVTDHVFYHAPTATSVLAYTEDVRATRFANGDFRGRHARLPDPEGARAGFVYGGNGLPPDIIAEIEADDPS
jgi:hypothetical protein